MGKRIGVREIHIAADGTPCSDALHQVVTLRICDLWEEFGCGNLWRSIHRYGTASEDSDVREGDVLNRDTLASYSSKYRLVFVFAAETLLVQVRRLTCACRTRAEHEA